MKKTNGRSKTHARVKTLKLQDGYRHIYKDFDSIKKAFLNAGKSAKKKASALLSEQMETAVDKSNEVKVNVAHYAKVKPFKTIGIAMLIGGCLGMWMRG